MSDYYEDTSYYCYSAPAHYVDTSYDDYSPPAHYVDTSYDDYIPPAPTPTYYVETPSYNTDPTYCDTSSDLIDYDDTPSESYGDTVYPESLYYDEETEPIHSDAVTTWSSPLSHAHELEAYADMAYNRTYTEDEIHPAYRVHPVDPPSDPIYYYDTSPDMSNGNREEPPIPEHHWKEYTWKFHKFDGGIIKYDPPTDPTFYIPSSHDNAPDWDLVQSIELIGSVLKDYRDFFTGNADDDDIEEWTPHVNQLTLVSQHMEEILARRKTDVKDDDEIDCENDNGNPLPQSTSPPHYISDKNFVTTPSPDTRTPDPLPPSPNVRFEPTHLTSAFLIATVNRREPRYHLGPHVRRRRSSPKFRNNTSTTPPPDIRTPKPFPPSPNISVRQSKIHLPHNHHPPDICAPRPLPQKPNISTQTPIFQQPCCPPRLRPRRKHPPHPMNQVHSLTPHHYHNVIRRILKKSRPHLFQMFEGEHHLEGTRCVMAPFPLSLFHSPNSIPFSSLAYTPLF
jgi:hypothetical protein